MKEFKNKVAVITGAGNGFGVEFAKECAVREMKIVLVDIESDDVSRTLDLMKSMGAEAIAVTADVTIQSEVEMMINTTMEKYGQIDLLINNAGVAITGRVWELPPRDFEWALNANVMSQVYAMNLVIPIMLKQGTACHILNVASVAGLITSSHMPAYHASKHASVALSETTSYDLQAINANIKVSVFCPGFVQTDLHNCERHRPERYKAPDDPYYTSDAFKAGQARAAQVILTGMPIDSIGMSVFSGIEDDDFYILTHAIYNPLIGKRVKDMLEGKGPDIKTFAK